MEPTKYNRRCVICKKPSASKCHKGCRARQYRRKEHKGKDVYVPAE